MGKGTSLGGVRPKCTVIDENGMLAIGKFPSVSDTRSVTRGEFLALQLAKSAGIVITNIDDHLQNLGFLHLNQDKWKLAPAFDLNPFPDKDRESKTWLSEDMGPVVNVTQLIENCDYFALTLPKALKVLGEVHQAVANWRTLAFSASVGLKREELDDFVPAFEHDQMEKARGLL
jgi:HipA-like C-terminal domain